MNNLLKNTLKLFESSFFLVTNVSDGGYRASQTRTPVTQQARPNSIEIENQQNRQTRITGNGHGNFNVYKGVTLIINSINKINGN